MKKIFLLALIFGGSLAYALGTVTGGITPIRKGESTFALKDSGAPILGVRNDSNSVLTGTDLTYGPLAITSTGILKVQATIAENATASPGDTTNNSSIFKVAAGIDQNSVVRGLRTDENGGLVAGGKDTKASARYDYSGASVVTSAYTQVIASLAADCSEVEIFDSSGQTLWLAVGAPASEVNKLLVIPGGNGKISQKFTAGDRISLKAISADATGGEFDINCYH